MNLPPMDWIEKAIRISSVTHKSNEEIVRFLLPLIESTPLKVVTQEVEENGEKFINLFASSHTPHSPNLLALHTHLDTVSPGDPADWTKTQSDPFQATRVRDRIYGLGTADVKLDFLCKLWAAKQTTHFAQPVTLVGSYGEERGLVGTEKLLDANKIQPKHVLVGEPSNLELVYAHKGHLICQVTLELDVPKGAKARAKTWRGKAAHSSTPQLGINALQKALTDLFKRGLGVTELSAGTDSNKIPDRCQAQIIGQKTLATEKLFQLNSLLEETLRDLKSRRDTRFDPAVTTLSLNQAVTTNGKLALIFDLRSLPDVDLKRVEKKLRSQIEALGLNFEVLSMDSALRGRKEGRFINHVSRFLKQCGVKKVAKKTKASSTEAALYQEKGATAIVFGPGRSIGNVHRPNEFNSLSQMAVATQLYTELMSHPVGG